MDDTTLFTRVMIRVVGTGTGLRYCDASDLQAALTGSDIAGGQAGTRTFSAGVTCTVALPVTEADASYIISLGYPVDRIFGVPGKTTRVLQIDAPSAASRTCDWRLVR